MRRSSRQATGGRLGAAAEWARGRVLSPRRWARVAWSDWSHRAGLWVDRRSGQRDRRRFLRLFHAEHLWPDAFLSGGGHARPRWLGVPVWKLPLDSWVLQEIIAETRPEVIVETGTQYGGSTLFLAGMLDLVGGGEVISVDVDHSAVDPRVREHPRVTLVEGSSISGPVVSRVAELVGGRRAMVDLDSEHNHEHVLDELDAYAPLVAPGCYLVVEDTSLGRQFPPLGGWRGPGDAVEHWLPSHPEFRPDHARERLGTFSPGGFLPRVER
jgi:cephalosporin hydroxylase